MLIWSPSAISACATTTVLAKRQPLLMIRVLVGSLRFRPTCSGNGGGSDALTAADGQVSIDDEEWFAASAPGGRRATTIASCCPPWVAGRRRHDTMVFIDRRSSASKPHHLSFCLCPDGFVPGPDYPTVILCSHCFNAAAEKKEKLMLAAAGAPQLQWRQNTRDAAADAADEIRWTCEPDASHTRVLYDWLWCACFITLGPTRH